MLVQRKLSEDPTVIGPKTKLEKTIALIRPELDSLPVKFYKNRDKTLFSPAWLPFSNVVKKINQINPDIVHLHWICGGMISIEDIAKIKPPIVWSLHDNWAFTGGCHIKWDCEKYKQSCGACPRLGSSKENDLSRKVWIRKRKAFSKISNMTIVGLSKWIAECAKESSLFRGIKIVSLPNPIDTDVFKPFDKEKSRYLWNLPQHKKLILFGAINATSDPNKGFTKLSEALKTLKRKDIELVVFGSSRSPNFHDLGFNINYVGHLHDDISLVTLYNAVDVVVVPSLQENLSNTIIESLSCGIPVVAFNVGGNSEIIEHKKNGYLAKPFDVEDLAKGIEWVLDNSKYQEISKNAREKIVKEFDSKLVARMYIELYKDILKNRW